MPTKITTGVGGRGTAVNVERKSHPNSHFEIHEMRIKKAHDGSFVIHHEMRLKKRHESKDDYMGSYREPETHTAQDAGELMAHVKKHMGGAAAPMAAAAGAEPDADDK